MHLMASGEPAGKAQGEPAETWETCGMAPWALDALMNSCLGSKASLVGRVRAAGTGNLLASVC